MYKDYQKKKNNLVKEKYLLKKLQPFLTVLRVTNLLVTFKAIYQLAPSYICNLVRLKEKCKYQLRSSEELLLQLPMGKTKKTLGDRSFQIAAPAPWNSLPASVRDIDNFLVFKRTIKTYLFRKAFALDKF